MVRCARIPHILDEIADTIDGPQSILSHQVYKITNVETGTVLDLSRDDNRTVLGYGDNGGQNQRVGLPPRLFGCAIMIDSRGMRMQWVVAGEGVGRALHVQGSDIFLSVDGMSRSGANVVAMQQPFTWNIVPAGKDNSYRCVFLSPGHSSCCAVAKYSV